jgi:hypothetical protein
VVINDSGGNAVGVADFKAFRSDSSEWPVSIGVGGGGEASEAVVGGGDRRRKMCF